MSLKKLSEDLKGSVEPLKIKVEDKFDEISVVIKETTITLSEWDIETEEGVRHIGRTRDEQVTAITCVIPSVMLHSKAMSLSLYLCNHFYSWTQSERDTQT